MGQLGFTVAGGVLVGWACGFGVDRLIGHGRIGQVVGIFAGLAGGALAAWRELRAAVGKWGEGRR